MTVSLAARPTLFAALEKHKSLIDSWSRMARTAAMTGRLGSAGLEDTRKFIAGQQLSLIQLEAKFERMAGSIMEEEKIRQAIARRESAAASIAALEEELRCADQELASAEREKESAEFAVKFLLGK